MDAAALPTVLMVMLCLRCTLGGAEKRYARFFELLVAQAGGHHRLLINRSMLTLLQAAGILTHHADKDAAGAKCSNVAGHITCAADDEIVACDRQDPRWRFG